MTISNLMIGQQVIQKGRKRCGIGEIAHYEQFLLFPQCFLKDMYHRQEKTRTCLGKG